jgi:hypothetical protein
MFALHKADGRGGKAGVEDIGQNIHCIEGQLPLLVGERPKEVMGH